MRVCLDLPYAIQILGGWLFNWQTLISGILALVAAAFSVCFLRKQISQTDKLHQLELRRRHNAARSVVPIALAAISDFCRKISEQIATAIEDRQNDYDAALDMILAKRDKQRRFENVEIPSDVISTMKSFVESLSDRADVRHIAELLSSMQMLQARFNEFDLQRPEVVNGLYSLLLDTAKVALLNDSIYNYGRFVDEDSFSIVTQSSIDCAWQKIQGKAHSLVFMRSRPDLFFADLENKVSSYKNLNISPWNEKFG